MVHHSVLLAVRAELSERNRGWLPKLVLTAAVVVGAVACGMPSPVATATPTADAIDAAVADAAALREAWGLRSDIGWVSELSTDRDAIRRGRESGIGIPVTALEAEAIRSRDERSSVVARVIARYAETIGDEWAGMWVDQEAGGSIVVQVTTNLERHRASMTRLLGPFAHVEYRVAPRSLAYLEDLWDRIREDTEWMGSIDAKYAGGGIDIESSELAVDILTHNPDAAAKIMSRYGDPEALRVSVGTDSSWPAGGGILTVVVQDGRGQPVPDLGCVLIPEDPRMLPDGSPGTGTDDNGICASEVGVGHYLVHITRQGPGGETVVGEGTVDVARGGQPVLTITVN